MIFAQGSYSKLRPITPISHLQTLYHPQIGSRGDIPPPDREGLRRLITSGREGGVVVLRKGWGFYALRQLEQLFSLCDFAVSGSLVCLRRLQTAD